MTWPEVTRVLSRVDYDRLVGLVEAASKDDMLTVLLNIVEGHNYDAQQALLQDLNRIRASKEPYEFRNEDEVEQKDQGGRVNDNRQSTCGTSSTDASIGIVTPARSSDIASLLNPVQEATQAVNQAVTALQPKGIKRSATEANAEDETQWNSEQKRLKAYHQSLLARCLNCGTFCDKLETANDVCIFHDGKLVVEDWDEAFPDEDRTVEELDTDYTRIELPEYFTWDCCDKTGEHGGCQKGHHVFTGSKTHQCRLEMLKEI